MSPYLMDKNTQRTISWIKAAQKDFFAFPLTVQDEIKDSLTFVADGYTPKHVKPMKGLDSGVYEIALRYRTDAYRVVYAVLIGNQVWVIHAFQKKSKTGIKTNKQDINLIRDRIKRLKEELL